MLIHTCTPFFMCVCVYTKTLTSACYFKMLEQYNTPPWASTGQGVARTNQQL